MKKTVYIITICFMLAVLAFGISQIVSVIEREYWFEQELLEASLVLLFAITTISNCIICLFFRNRDRFYACIEVIKEEREERRNRSREKKIQRLQDELTKMNSKSDE